MRKEHYITRTIRRQLVWFQEAVINEETGEVTIVTRNKFVTGSDCDADLDIMEDAIRATLQDDEKFIRFTDFGPVIEGKVRMTELDFLTFGEFID